MTEGNAVDPNPTAAPIFRSPRIPTPPATLNAPVAELVELVVFVTEVMPATFNRFAIPTPPVICKPLEHGAAVVVYSLTKYIAGHGTVVGGALVDGGNFDWTADPKRQPLFNQPDASYGGVIWGKAVPELTGANVSFAVRARVTLLRDLGSALSPDNAFGVIQGLETVALRMKQHCENAAKVVDYLKKHKAISKVIYATEHNEEISNRAKKYLKNGNGALVGIELAGGIEAGKKFIESLKCFIMLLISVMLEV